jgi:hypothetical protein
VPRLVPLALRRFGDDSDADAVVPPLPAVRLLFHEEDERPKLREKDTFVQLARADSSSLAPSLSFIVEDTCIQREKMLQASLRISCVLACGRERTRRRFSSSRSPYVLSSSSSVPCPSPAARGRCGDRRRAAQTSAPAQSCTAAAHALRSLPWVRVRSCSARKKAAWRAAGTYMRTRQLQAICRSGKHGRGNIASGTLPFHSLRSTETRCCNEGAHSAHVCGTHGLRVVCWRFRTLCARSLHMVHLRYDSWIARRRAIRNP